MDPTTHPDLRSFVEVPDRHAFPIQNLPFGVFSRPACDTPRVGVRIGDFVLDLWELSSGGLLGPIDGLPSACFARPSLNEYLAAGRDVWGEVRRRISALLQSDNPELRDATDLRARTLVPIEEACLHLPVAVGDYTDFYSGKQHAFNVGVMFRDPKQALLPNYLWMPVAYHGRASSIVVSGADIRRPCGQRSPARAGRPEFGPTKCLDFELEVGFVVGAGNPRGRPIGIADAQDHIFGLVLVNDWSARDIQKWEYQPLGPFLAKNFATTISPWVVQLEALEPFRCPGGIQDPPPLEYLRLPTPSGSDASAGWWYDVNLEVSLRSAKMSKSQTVCRTNFDQTYWAMIQQLTHHTVTGCNVRPGDLMASGTISGPTPDSFGSMLELAWGGKNPLPIDDGSRRRFLEDGDTVTVLGWAENADYRIGFGECAGTILPAVP